MDFCGKESVYFCYCRNLQILDFRWYYALLFQLYSSGSHTVSSQHPGSQNSSIHQPLVISIFLSKSHCFCSIFSLCILSCFIRCSFVAAFLFSATFLLFVSALRRVLSPRCFLIAQIYAAVLFILCF